MMVLVDLPERLVPQIEAYARELSRLLAEHYDTFVFCSLPGAGGVTAARLLEFRHYSIDSQGCD